uniref:Uncharacterized protein n=1 Tax=Rhizophora mucronata TaxID=61149 RepID=A0A2P2LYN5_RHIMU
MLLDGGALCFGRFVFRRCGRVCLAVGKFHVLYGFDFALEKQCIGLNRDNKLLYIYMADSLSVRFSA